MSVHILKPALKISDIYAFAERQKQWHTPYQGGMAFPVWTSRKPARVSEMLDGGSVYWIVKKAIQVRQTIIGFEDYPTEEDEKPSYLMMCETQLIRTQAYEKRPFQGWRYLEDSNAPPDIGELHEDDGAPPPDLEIALREAGLL